MLLLALAACPPAAPEFTCATAPTLLGHPTATVEACDPAPNLPEIYQVALRGGDLPGREVYGVHLTEGRLDPTTGEAALASFLDGLGDRRKALTMRDMMAVLRAFAAFPQGFDPAVSMFDLPKIGTSKLQSEPFRLELYNGHPPEPGFVRAVLSGPPWQWTMGTLAEGAADWQDQAPRALGRPPN